MIRVINAVALNTSFLSMTVLCVSNKWIIEKT